MLRLSRLYLAVSLVGLALSLLFSLWSYVAFPQGAVGRPGQGGGHANVSVSGAEVSYRRGFELLAKGKFEEAQSAFSQAVVASPQDTHYLEGLALAKYNARDLAGAQTVYEEILKLDEENAPAENGLANVLRDLGERDEASMHYERAIRFDPTLTVAYLNLAYLLRDEGKDEEANATLRRGIAKNPGAKELESALATLR